MKPIKVSQLNNYLKKVLLNDPLLGNVRVVGEVSNLNYHGTGHVYFNLKDENGRLACFLAAQNAEKLDFMLDEGMEIVAEGYVSVYEKGGSYSLNIRNIELQGQGELAVAFEKLKEKLEKEGLFSYEHKKALPSFPRKIALVTSPTGAAVQDMIKIIGMRNSLVDITVFPVLVQGERAAADIAHMIDFINENPEFNDIDVMIVGRGGGAAEELWAFNEEIVARAIYASRIPIVSAVGHEIDFSVSDFVADARAATPTAAAAMVAPNTFEMAEDADRLKDDLAAALIRYIAASEQKLNSMNFDFFSLTFKNRLSIEKGELETASALLNASITDAIDSRERELFEMKAALSALNPHQIMNAGYAAILDGLDILKSSATDFKAGDDLHVKFSDGDVDCVVKEVRTYG